ncbi:MAG: barstar family protein [Clostridia bacterium]|nr:barstar family protein [Lachnospiraceae bacterium]MBQ7541035.1 barstar family protein [Clostridia bacterium]
MQYVFLDGARILTNNDLHAAFAEVLAPGEDYGKNLDALHDVLTDRVEPLGIVIVNEALLREHLGRRANGFFRLLRDLQEDGAVRVAAVSLDAPEVK